jgi:hypothetical protein
MVTTNNAVRPIKMPYLILLCHIRKLFLLTYFVENTRFMWYPFFHEKKKSMGHRDYDPQPTGTIKNLRKEFVMPTAPFGV